MLCGRAAADAVRPRAAPSCAAYSTRSCARRRRQHAALAAPTLSSGESARAQPSACSAVAEASARESADGPISMPSASSTEIVLTATALDASWRSLACAAARWIGRVGGQRAGRGEDRTTAGQASSQRARAWRDAGAHRRVVGCSRGVLIAHRARQRVPLEPFCAWRAAGRVRAFRAASRLVQRRGRARARRARAVARGGLGGARCCAVLHAVRIRPWGLAGCRRLELARGRHAVRAVGRRVR